jgi:hypothetical protein
VEILSKIRKKRLITAAPPLVMCVWFPAMRFLAKLKGTGKNLAAIPGKVTRL